MTVESEVPEINIKQPQTTDGIKPQLRTVDLNLLTVFDAVMQEQNITRAAHTLGMSQPAVSNAVARLKVMFNDELFVRYGRGIQPTARAFQLFGSIRQALQLVQNELPGSGFEPLSSERVFNLCVCSPLDNYLTSIIYNKVEEIAPNIHLVFKSSLNQNTEHQLRYQETEFVLGYEEFRRPEFSCVPLFKDEMVLVASKNTPDSILRFGKVTFIASSMLLLRSTDMLPLACRGMTRRINRQALLYQGNGNGQRILNVWSRRHIWWLLHHAGWLKSFPVNYNCKCCRCRSS